MKTIPLTKGQVAKVDDADFEKFADFKWCASWSKSANGFYAVRAKPRKPGEKRGTLQLHREIMGNPSGFTVDHIDHDTLNCRRDNLRVCTHAENQRNRRGPSKNSKSRIRGVSWDRSRSMWRACLRINGKQVQIGRFSDIGLATAAYETANRLHYGEYGGGLR